MRELWPGRLSSPRDEAGLHHSLLPSAIEHFARGDVVRIAVAMDDFPALGKALGQAIKDRLDLLPTAGRGFGAKQGDRVMVPPQSFAGMLGISPLLGHQCPSRLE